MADIDNYKETLKEIYDTFKKYNLTTLDDWIESDLEELAVQENKFRTHLEEINNELKHKLEMGEFPFYKVYHDDYPEDFIKIINRNSGNPIHQNYLWKEFKKIWSDQGIGVEVDEGEEDMTIIYLIPEVVRYREPPIGVYNG